MKPLILLATALLSYQAYTWTAERIQIAREAREQCSETYERGAVCLIVRVKEPGA